MKNPLKQFLTGDEQKILIFIITLAIIGLFAKYTATTDNNNKVNTIDSLKTPYTIKYDLKSVTKEELTSIPGIGTKRAELILAYRNQNGFHSTHELTNIKGIGENTFQKIAKYFYNTNTNTPTSTNNKELSPTSVKTQKININTANINELTQLKGIGPTKAKQIINYRNSHGKFENIDQLLNIKGIGIKTLNKIKNRLSIGEE